MNVRIASRVLVALVALTEASTAAANVPAVDAQTQTPASPPATGEAPQAPPQDDEDEIDVDLRDLSPDIGQPDFTLVALPTNLRVPRHKTAFRVTHRFTRSLSQGDAGDLLADFFGFDGSAIIGLEVRFGLMRGTQAGIHRTSDRTIELFGQHNFMRQDDTHPFSVDGLATIEGIDNLKDEHSPGLGLILSRKFGDRGAMYLQPVWVGNTNLLPRGDDNTFFIGMGARVRLDATVYLVLEGAPRVSGYKLDMNHVAFAIEKRIGGHGFQVNVSNSFSTTLAQIARGGFNDNWHIGFNISRKFF